MDHNCTRKTSGENTCGLGGKHTDIGAAMYWEVHSSGEHTASRLSEQDCTTVYGDRRGITDDETV